MKQIFIQTAAADLLGKAAQYKKDGYRMVQILCTRVPEGYELTYSFDKDYVMENLRVVVPLECYQPVLVRLCLGKRDP